MKRTLVGVILVVLALPLIAPVTSEAGGTRAHVGITVGGGGRFAYHGGYYGYGYRVWGPRVWGPRYWGPRVWVGPTFWWGAPYFGYPYYYPSPPAVIQQPPVYLEPSSPPQEPQYWYYCQSPQGYYPYVQKCPGGWMKVVPPGSPPEQ